MEKNSGIIWILYFYFGEDVYKKLEFDLTLLDLFYGVKSAVFNQDDCYNDDCQDQVKKPTKNNNNNNIKNNNYGNYNDDDNNNNNNINDMTITTTKIPSPSPPSTQQKQQQQQQ